MLSDEERRAAAIYEASGDLYKAAEASGLSPAEVIHAIGTARRLSREAAPVKKCETCPWRREGLEHCVLPRCML
ncbi:hypothetical protein CE91St44_16070 [Oscillospiraceae bacterium]|nr:hypothetical protein CE91St44_16070 [Oscillospiraceae bacterium]DAI92775.1 MAG TPA: hypothetical protein [Caudoviricetes sp.]